MNELLKAGFFPSEIANLEEDIRPSKYWKSN